MTREIDTQLLDAAIDGDLAGVIASIEAGANINAFDDEDEGEETALMLAAGEGHLDIVNYLIEQGAEEDFDQEFIKPGLMSAAQNGYWDVVERLIGIGADISAFDEEFNTPLTLAAKAGCLEDVEKLIELGAKIFTGYFKTALGQAAANGHLEVVERLVELGAPIDLIDNTEATALLYALHQGHAHIANRLIELGADINASGEACLEFVDYYGKLDVVEKLLRAGADPSLLNSHGRILDPNLQDVIKTAIISWKQSIGEVLSQDENAFLRGENYNHEFARDCLKGRSKQVAWKIAIKKELSEGEKKFKSSESYDKALAQEYLEARADRVIKKLKANSELSLDESTFLNNPEYKYLGAFKESIENSKFIASTTFLTGGYYLPGNALNIMFEYLPKEQALKYQAIVISRIKGALDCYQINVNGEKRVLTPEEKITEDYDKLLDLHYHLMRSSQGENIEVYFEIGEEVNVSSLLAKIKQIYQAKAAQARFEFELFYAAFAEEFSAEESQMDIEDGVVASKKRGLDSGQDEGSSSKRQKVDALKDSEDDADLAAAIDLSLEGRSSEQESDSNVEGDQIIGYFLSPDVTDPSIYGYAKQDDFCSILDCFGKDSKTSSAIVELSAEVKKFFAAMDVNNIDALQAMLVVNPSLANATDANGMTALAHANAFGHFAQVNILVEHNAYAHEFEPKKEDTTSTLESFVNYMLDYMPNVMGYGGMIVGALCSMQSHHITTKNIDQ